MKNKTVTRTFKLTALIFIVVQATLQLAIAESDTKNAIWNSAFIHLPGSYGLDYSVEYQLRHDIDRNSLSSQFGEFSVYRKLHEYFRFYGGYRFTSRPDHEEQRVVVGGFWDITPYRKSVTETGLDPFRLILQVAYQHDFNIEFDDVLMGSDSVRCVLVAEKSLTKKIQPFLMTGVLTTWNDAYDFGIDKLRIGGGVVYKLFKNNQLRIQYILEKNLFMDSPSFTNIVWVRYEIAL